MATTSAELAATVLDCLTASGVEFAILHGEAAVAQGVCSSDVDVVTRADAHSIIARAHARLRDHGLHPVVVWPYDVGSTSVFVVDAAAINGAQFDILHDPVGSGHYGVRAGAILSNSQPGTRWRRAAADDEQLYLIRKRLRKGQHDRLAALLAQARDAPADNLVARATQVFSAQSAAAVRAAIRHRPPPPDPLRRVRAAAANASRIVSRLRHPVGFWVAVGGPAARPTAEVVTARFGRLLPAAGCGTARGLLESVRQVAPVRWRAGIFTSWDRPPALARPDLYVHASSEDEEEVLGHVVSAMERRLQL